MSNSNFVNKTKDQYNSIKLKTINIFLLKVYDFLIYLSRNYPHKFSNRIIHNICKKYNLKRKTILDVGSYTGYYTFYFHCERNYVTGVELSDKINIAKKRYSNYNIEFINGDINQVYGDSKNKKFDFIFSANLPLHYDTGSILTSFEFDKFIDNSLEHLDKGGVLLYIFFSSKHDKVAIPVNIDELREYCLRKKLINYKIESTYLLNEQTVELEIVK